MVSYEPSDSTGVAYGESHQSLADIATPSLIDSQVSKFTVESMRAVTTRNFDPRATIQALGATDDAEVAGIDIGGDKLIATFYDVRAGVITPTGTPLVKEGTAGAGYMEVVEKVAALARTKLLPMGISYAGPVNGSKVLAGVNIPVFMRDFLARYDGDFANIYPKITLVNDGAAGVMAASVEALRRYPTTQNVIYVINGSGLGGAVLKGDVVFAAEPGHVQAENDLNVFDQRKLCGMFGAQYVCLENIGASKAGIEDIWFQQRGEKRTGREIAAAYLAGDNLALLLYENSAWVTAHVVKGMAHAVDLLRAWDDTVIVGHGGAFQVPGYGERVRTILEKSMSATTRMMFTKDFSSNACLDGAGIAGVVGAL